MKATLFLLGIITVSLSACTSIRTQSGVIYKDDIYYNPKGKPLVVSEEFVPVITDPAVQKADQKVYNQKAREYSKSVNDNDSRDFSQIQAQYANILSDESIADVDTMVYYNDETGYWVDGFSGSSSDQEYAERIARFHGPFNGIPYWSPLYTQVVYFNNPDWNVYVDGNYAYVFPSWSNRFYSNFYYGGGYRSYWNSYLGFGSPYFGFGFGFSSGWYDPWYSSYYGWGGYSPYWGYNPYGYGYGYGSHYWHHHGHPYYPGGNIAGNQTRPSHYYGSRTGNSSTSVGNINHSSSYRRPSDRYSASPSNSGSRTMSVTRDGNTVTTSGRVVYSRPGNTGNASVNKNSTTGNSNVVSGNAVRNPQSTRESSQRGSTTVTKRYESGSNNAGTSSRPSYQPGSASRSTSVERSGSNNTIRSGSSSPSYNGSTYTPSRSGGSSNSGSSGRTNRR